MQPQVPVRHEPGHAGDISREELERRLRDRSLVIVDVLPPAAYASGHIPGAVNLPLAELQQRASEVLPDRDAESAGYADSFAERRAPKPFFTVPERNVREPRNGGRGSEECQEIQSHRGREMQRRNAEVTRSGAPCRATPAST